MSSLEELKAQIAELERQAAEVRSREKVGVIEQIKEQIALYELTPSDLGFNVSSLPLRELKFQSRAGKAKPNPKYRDEHGNEWSGGRGRKPQWVVALLEAGGDIEQYRIAD